MIDLAAKGKCARAIALSLGVGKKQIQGILDKKTSIIQSWKEGMNEWQNTISHCKKKQERQPKPARVGLVCKGEVVELRCHWPILQEKAWELVKAMDYTTFKVLNGWLQAFKKWYGAKSLMLGGEAADVRDADVEDWKLRLPKLCDGYSLDNIFNTDETGLFYRTHPKSLMANGDRCKGGKKKEIQ